MQRMNEHTKLHQGQLRLSAGIDLHYIEIDQQRAIKSTTSPTKKSEEVGKGTPAAPVLKHASVTLALAASSVEELMANPFLSRRLSIRSNLYTQISLIAARSWTTFSAWMSKNVHVVAETRLLFT